MPGQDAKARLVNLSILPERMMYAVDCFPLMAVPFFMLAGERMVLGGTMDRSALFLAGVVPGILLALSMMGVVSGITRLSVEMSAFDVWPYVVLQFGVLALCVVCPGLVAFLPRLFGVQHSARLP